MTMLAAGAEHTAAVTANGKLYGWGWGRYGNLGLGDRNDRLVPGEVASVTVCALNIFDLLLPYLHFSTHLLSFVRFSILESTMFDRASRRCKIGQRIDGCGFKRSAYLDVEHGSDVGIAQV